MFRSVSVCGAQETCVITSLTRLSHGSLSQTAQQASFIKQLILSIQSGDYSGYLDGNICFEIFTVTPIECNFHIKKLTVISILIWSRASMNSPFSTKLSLSESGFARPKNIIYKDITQTQILYPRHKWINLFAMNSKVSWASPNFHVQLAKFSV